MATDASQIRSVIGITDRPFVIPPLPSLSKFFDAVLRQISGVDEMANLLKLLER